MRAACAARETSPGRGGAKARISSGDGRRARTKSPVEARRIPQRAAVAVAADPGQAADHPCDNARTRPRCARERGIQLRVAGVPLRGYSGPPRAGAPQFRHATVGRGTSRGDDEAPVEPPRLDRLQPWLRVCPRLDEVHDHREAEPRRDSPTPPPPTSTETPRRGKTRGHARYFVATRSAADRYPAGGEGGATPGDTASNPRSSG